MKISLLFSVCLVLGIGSVKGQQDSSKPETAVNIHHIVLNNSLQYLLVETKIKNNKKWQPLRDQQLEIFLDSTGGENVISKCQTDSDGKAKLIIPASLQSKWKASPTHKFIAVTSDGAQSDIEISRARILIDTTNVDSVRTVNVQVTKWADSAWQPAKNVEVKIGVKRLGGQLKIGDEESYTTDSLGAVSAEFKLDSLPADEHGNLALVARIEDDEHFGSLSVEKVVPWGIYQKPESNFGARALWAARGKAPIWLMFMAYSIIAAVWGVIFYLIFRIVKISKLGEAESKATQTLA